MQFELVSPTQYEAGPSHYIFRPEPGAQLRSLENESHLGDAVTVSVDGADVRGLDSGTIDHRKYFSATNSTEVRFPGGGNLVLRDQNTVQVTGVEEIPK